MSTAVRLFAFLITLLLVSRDAVAQSITLPQKPSAMTRYAAQELQRYVFQLSGKRLPLTDRPVVSGGFVLATATSGRVLPEKTNDLKTAGNQGYLLFTKNKTLYILANTDTGLLYGVYGLLDDYYGVGFSFAGDALPQTKKPFYLPAVNEVKSPSMQIRGVLPWTNFPQSATVYSWDDWRFVIDQAAKQRLNFLHIHNYNGQNGHNEPYHNFEVNGLLSRVWMPTAKTGHGWACKGFDVKDYRFGAQDLIGDYDFGSEVGLHNETLDNHTVFAKGVNLFQRVIGYAHSRGLKMGLGLDIDLVLPEYKLPADDPRVIEARMHQVLTDYPDLDYLILFVSEMINAQPEKLRQWRGIFDGMYAYAKRQPKHPRMAVAGWGLSAELAASLPPDVIAAPISHYSDGFEPGAIYGDREYWGCPWTERDFFSSQYYYPYNMHLQNTVAAWQKRSPNMQGFYTLTWRLTDAVAPKIDFVAKAPWDKEGRLATARDVYRNYARKHYGESFADTLAGLLDRREPLSVKTAECEGTASFTGKTFWETETLANLLQFQFFRSHSSSPLFHYANRSAVHQMGIDNAHSAAADSCFGWIKHGSWVKYEAVDFSAGFDSLRYVAATPNSDVRVELRLDSLDGKLAAVLPLTSTGGWHNWKTQTAPLQAAPGTHAVFFVVKAADTTDPVKRSDTLLAWLDGVLANERDKGNVQRLQYLKARLAAAQDHLLLNEEVPLTAQPSALPKRFASWVKNFTHRVVDISSLGNVMSSQNRYIQEGYLAKEAALLQAADIKFPIRVEARGTAAGAIITWEGNEPAAKGYHVYANGTRINKSLLPSTQTTFTHSANGRMRYTVTAVNAAGRESLHSPSADGDAGAADKEAPLIVVISPPASVKAGEAFELTARLLDDRIYEAQTATLWYREAGEENWKALPMTRRTKAIFCARLVPATEGLWEYRISATDGRNTAVYPATAPRLNQTVVVEPRSANAQRFNVALREQGGELQWSIHANAAYYKIYRGATPAFEPSAAAYVSFLPPTAVRFRPNGFGFDGKPLRGRWYYRVAAVAADGSEHSSGPVAVKN